MSGFVPARWALLVALSAGFAIALEAMHLPAAFMLGPMAAAILVAVGLAPVSMPRLPFNWAQGVVGCLIAHAVTVPLLVEIAHDWPVFVGSVLSVVGFSLAIGWLLTRWQVLPGSSAIWGTLPGAAPAMVLMAGDFGCDMGLVAFTQYIRVIIVSVLAAVIAAIVLPAPINGGFSFSPHLAATDWVGLLETLAFVVAVSYVSSRLRIPAGPLMAAMVAGALLQNLHVLRITLPQPLLMFGYCFVGWGIGLQFRRETLRRSVHALPAILVSTGLLVVACGGLAVILIVVTGLNPMTAYLATSPGGASSVAIIASDSHLDMAYIMAMQIARAWFLILAGPFLARTLAHWAGYREVQARGYTPGSPRS